MGLFFAWNKASAGYGISKLPALSASG